MARELLTLIEAAAEDRPHATALFAPDRPPLDYAGLRHEIDRMHTMLGGVGLGAGSRIATSLPNGPEAATIALGIASFASCAPLNPDYGAEELRFYLEDARAEAIVLGSADAGPARQVAGELGLMLLELDFDPAWPAGRVALRERGMPPGHGREPTRSDSGPALILHTSGTTAKPKIVPLTQANLAASAAAIARHLALGAQDRGLNVMPLFHIHGLVGSLFASIAAGASLVCTPGFDDARFFEWVAEFDPTWYTAVPTIHQAVLACGDDYRRRAPEHRFRMVRSSSASLPPRVFHALEALFDAPVIEAYGMTEASHQMASNPLPPAPRKPGSVGIPAGTEITILDTEGRALPFGETGEIAIRGPGVTAGYEDDPRANATAFTAGWFRTGDLGRIDSDGYLSIEGRIKEIVNRGGEKVSPREVDEALLDHPAVAQAAAFAIPHPTLGGDLAAAVVLRPGVEADATQLRAFLFDRLAEYKIPSQTLIVDAIPKGPTGKIQRTSLHQTLAGALDTGFNPPADDMERLVADVVAAVLERDRVGRDENFFAIGGDSLRGARVVARINDALTIDLRVTELFRHPTIAGFAARVGAERDERADEDARLIAEIDDMSDEDVERLLAGHEKPTGAQDGPH